MKRASLWARIGPAVKTTLLGLGFVAVVALLMLGLMGAFHEKVSGKATAAVPPRLAGAAKRTPVTRLRVPAYESAVGSIRPVREAAVASKLLARVLEVNVKAGQQVQAGAVLVRLDDADLRAQLQQAEAAQAAATAGRDQAKIEFDHVQQLVRGSAASQREVDLATTALKTAEAQLQGAVQAASVTRTILNYATITAPMTGIVVDKQVNAGDTVVPGKVLLNLYDPTQMQMVASVRDALTHRLKVGQEIKVRVDTLDKVCVGTVSEIVPESESASRSFLVKVTGPCQPGVYAGTFGRLLIPLDDEDVLAIPRTALRRVGQLDMVDVVEGAGPQAPLQRRAVQLGRPVGDQVQVLAGLRAGEEVVLP
jgi:RND family efflux transporter MFP subunit